MMHNQNITYIYDYMLCVCVCVCGKSYILYDGIYDSKTTNLLLQYFWVDNIYMYHIMKNVK